MRLRSKRRIRLRHCLVDLALSDDRRRKRQDARRRKRDAAMIRSIFTRDGHPGSTDRNDTVAELETLRSVSTDVFRALPWLLAFLAMVLFGKVLVVWLLARFTHLGARTLQLSVGLGQVGEFSYVLGALALGAGLISKEVSAGLIGAVVVSIAASSVLVRVAGRRPGTE